MYNFASYDTYLFKVNNKNTIATSDISLKLAIKTPEWHQSRRSGVIIVNFGQISDIALKFPVLNVASNAAWD